MSAIDEALRMANDGISLDVMTMVLRQDFSDDEIRRAYDTLMLDFGTRVERGTVTFVRS